MIFDISHHIIVYSILVLTNFQLQMFHYYMLNLNKIKSKYYLYCN